LTLEVGAPVDDGGDGDDADDCAAAAGGRDVPFTDVVALDEIGVFVLTVERTVAFVDATDACERADV
jgi:hypothetical protein